MALESRFDFEIQISPFAEKKAEEPKNDPAGAGRALDDFFARQARQNGNRNR